MIYLRENLQIVYKRKMAKFATCIRNRRNDGLYPVYIRVFHNGNLQYINTGLLVNDNGLRVSFDKNGRKQTGVVDRRVLNECLNRISGYVERMVVSLINCHIINCFL